MSETDDHVAGDRHADDQPADEPDGDKPNGDKPNGDKPDGNESSAVGCADWALPPWVRHPRLEGILGCRLNQIGWQQIVDLVDRQVAEDQSVDFKRRLYAIDRALVTAEFPQLDKDARDRKRSEERLELAKDVTALANASGGIIVIGIADKNGAAASLTPVPLLDANRIRLVDEIRNWTTPYIPDIEVGHLRSPEDASRGCVLIYVTASSHSPHAVSEPNTSVYRWFVRESTGTRALSESQISVAYRDRFAGQADTAVRARHAFDDGTARLDTQGQAWLAVALAPERSALPRTLDRHLQQTFETQTGQRQRELPTPWLGLHASYGRGHVVLRDSRAESRLAADHLLHLYTDGRAFAAVKLSTLEDTTAQLERRPDLPGDTKFIRVGSLALFTLGLIGITAGHAVDAGSSGDLELCCGLVAAIAPDESIFEPGFTPNPRVHVLVDQPYRPFAGEHIVAGSTPLESFTPVQVTASPVVADDARELVVLAAQVVNELSAEFGQLPADPVFTANVEVVEDFCFGPVESLKWWSERHGLNVRGQ